MRAGWGGGARAPLLPAPTSAQLWGPWIEGPGRYPRGGAWGAASSPPGRLRPLPAPADPRCKAASLGPPGQPPASSHAAGSSTIDPAPLLWAPACPPGPAPLRPHRPSAPQGPQPPSPGAQSLQTQTGGLPVSAPVQSGRFRGPSESKQTLGSASAAPGHPPAYPQKRRCCRLNSHVTLVGGEELFPSTWWGWGQRRLDQTSTSTEADGGWGSRGQPQTLGRGWGLRVRAEGVEGGLGRAPWPPTPRLWGDGRTRCRLGQTGDSSVLHSVRTEAAPAPAAQRDHFPSSYGPPCSRPRQEGSSSPRTLQAGLSAGPGA